MTPAGAGRRDDPRGPAPVVVLDLPLAGPLLVRNSPARRVPSHGTDLFAVTYAVDLVPCDERGRTSGVRDWRTALATEPPERFVGFGRPVLAPAAGVVVAVHDGEPDHPARRSQLSLVPYAAGQARRVRAGLAAVAGNHVVVRVRDGVHVAVVHLRRGSVQVAVGEDVVRGQVLAACGNSGNSTQPHVHLQAMDSPDATVARGLPLAFRDYRERVRGGWAVRDVGMPAEGSVVASTGRG